MVMINYPSLSIQIWDYPLTHILLEVNPGSSQGPELWLPQCQKQRTVGQANGYRRTVDRYKNGSIDMSILTQPLVPKLCSGIWISGSPSCKIVSGHVLFSSLLLNSESLPFRLTACTSKVHGPVDASWSLRCPDPAVQQVLLVISLSAKSSRKFVSHPHFGCWNQWLAHFGW